MGCAQPEPNEPSFSQSLYRKPRLFFALGGPGSGKAMFCEKLVRDYQLKYLCVKDMVQFETTRQSAYSREIKECLTKGSLIPSDTITRLIKRAIANYGPRAFLVDGFPRNMENAESFEALLEKEVQLAAVIYFDCSKACMHTKIVRDSDGLLGEEKISKLMELYDREVLPVVKHFALKGLLIRINTELHEDFELNYKQLTVALRLFGIVPAQRTQVVFATGRIDGRSKLLQSLCSRFGMHRISIPALLRYLQDNDREKQSDLVRHCLKQGKRIPTEVTIKLVWRQIQRRNYLGSFLLEGFPTTNEEIALWKQSMSQLAEVRGVIYFTPLSTGEQETLLRSQLMTIDSPFHYIDSELSDDKVKLVLQKKLEQEGNTPVVRKSHCPKIIMVVGAPGTGKGSQCDRLRRGFGFDYVSTAELLKQEIAERRLYAELIEEHIAAGRLVPSEILVRLIKRYIFEKRVGSHQPLLLDGFPRNIKNMQCWQEETGDEVDLVHILHFYCSQRIMEERLINTKNSRNLKYPPETIRKRFEQYLLQTEPVLEAYRGCLIEVEAEATVDEVYTQLQKLMLVKGYRLVGPN